MTYGSSVASGRKAFLSSSSSISILARRRKLIGTWDVVWFVLVMWVLGLTSCFASRGRSPSGFAPILPQRASSLGPRSFTKLLTYVVLELHHERGLAGGWRFGENARIPPHRLTFFAQGRKDTFLRGFIGFATNFCKKSYCFVQKTLFP